MADALPRFLLVSAPLDAEGAEARLAEALADAENIAAVLVRGGDLDDPSFARRIPPLVAAAQAKDVAVLLEDRPELLAASGADGLHVTLGDKGSPVRELRRRFGDDVIIGAGCGASRHLAMTSGEQGADYVAFGALDGAPENGGPADPELIAWWEAVMTPPQVACGARDLDQARALAAAGPDFLAVGPDLWPAPEAPAAALRRLLEALSERA